MEKAFPMFMLGTGCIFVTAIVFGILCGNMIRARRLISFFFLKYAQENNIIRSNRKNST